MIGPKGWATSSVPAWARRSWTTPPTPSAATPTSPTWPRLSATSRRSAGPSERRRHCSTSSRTTGGTTLTAQLVRGLAGRSRQPEGVPAALDRAHPNRRRAAETPGPPIGAAGIGRAREHDARPARDGTASPASLGFSTPAPGRPRLRLATLARAATRWSQRCPASGSSSRSTAPSPR